MNRNTAVIILSIGLILSTGSCINSNNSTSGKTPQLQIPTAEVVNPTITLISPSSTTESISDTPTMEATIEPVISRPHYTFILRLDIQKHMLDVQQIVSYVNRSSDPLNEILLVVDPNRFTGAFMLEACTWEDGSQIEDLIFEETILRLPLSAPLEINHSIRFSLKYTINIPYQSGIFGWTDRQTNLGYWYPFVPPYHPETGWQINKPGDFGEYLVLESADYDITLKMVKNEQEVQIAASAPLVEDGDDFHYTLRGARTFAFSILTGFIKIEGKVGNTQIWVYALPGHQDAGEASLATIIEVLPFYEELFGPYPFESLTVVEMVEADSMEFDGMFLLGEYWFTTYNNTPANYLVMLTAHETAHNWWFSQVGNDPAQEPWLDEALSIYCELLYYEYFHPELVPWWWDYRLDIWDPIGPVNGTVYEFNEYEDYRRAVYLRGAQFVQTIRDAMGDEAFFAFLRSYADQGKHQIMTGEQFLGLIREYSRLDTNTLTVEYFKK
jgi:hypothetical protein